MFPTVQAALVTADAFTPLLTTIQENAAVIVPAGIGILVVVRGIKMLPGLIKTWTRG